MKSKIVLFLLAGATLYCQSSVSATPSNLDELTNLSQNSAENSHYVDGIPSSEIDQLRYKAMIEAAQVLGLQEGIKHRQEQINDELAEIADELNRIYNFRALLLNDGIMIPPVIDEVEGSLKIEEDGSINASERTYIIRKDAKLTIDPPSWRSHLIHHYGVTDRINKAILPKTDKEQLIWKKSIEEAWNKGIDQANYMFSINLNRLTRDYLGMARFKSLAKQRIVDIPMVARGDLGIRVNGRKLDIGQNTFRITNHSSFQTKGWKAFGSIAQGER
ncbi:type IV secretory system conjugative DNA transfer family protein (plasmid) [Methylomarinum sp. Ch1-1]|uniref:Type IV secretory system conjugative DNA transfer family protein n=1 Tax=Methylomarinum roseum TaxID=3067653 RepID=A0AAU7P0N4_9GAMM|nr:type IV secretory system conjugative DNA transfer family protein [Methylomarinum sp. Ch1-1]MDP4523200.1 type IV secretory system conjugative DNA transfer family protein [Methylomarinum sp. Ch1-1]